MGEFKEEPPKSRFEQLLADYDVTLDAAYNAALEDRRRERLKFWKKPDGPHLKGFGLDIIPVSEKNERLRRVEAKVGDYSRRLQAEWENKKSGRITDLTPSWLYKRDFLRLVLKQNDIDPEALWKAYATMNGSLLAEQFTTARNVIYDYLKTGGKNLIQGSGLPAVATTS